MCHRLFKQFLIFLTGSTLSVFACAEFLSGADLGEYFDALQRTKTEKVRDGDWQKVATLQGFVMGVSDSVRGVRFCAPKGASLGQLIDITEGYVSAHPDLWDRPAVDVTVKALSTAFPCQR